MGESTIHVRQAEAVDAASFADLVSATLSECFDAVVPGDELAQWVATYRDRAPEHTCYVAEMNGTLMGYAVTDGGGPGHRHPVAIERMYIRHEPGARDAEQQQQVASALVDAIIADSEASPTHETSEGVTLALTMLERWGFADVRAMRHCLTSSSSNGRLLSDGVMEW